MRLPAYPKYKPTGVEWLGDVPEHWEVKRGRFCMEINPRSQRQRALRPDDEVSFVPMEAVGEYGGLDLGLVRSIADVESGYTEFDDGDVLVAKITPCFENGKGAFATGLLNKSALGTTELLVLRAFPALDRRFLFYVTISQPFRNTGEGAMYGAGGQKRVPLEFCANFRIQLPSPAEQHAIADFLDCETAKIDILVSTNRTLIEHLKEKRIALISRTVTRGLPPDAARAAGLDPHPKLKPTGIDWLGEVPEHWALLRIATESTKITNGYVGPTRDILVDDGVPYLQSLHIKDNRIVFSRRYFVRQEWSLNHSKSILAAGDVLIVQTGDIGQSAVVPAEFAGANCHALIIVSPRRDRLYGAFLSQYLNSTFGFHELKRIQTGALHPHLNCGLVRDMRIPSPPLREQIAIADYLEHDTAMMDVMIAKVETAIERLQEYRTALITAAVAGKIDVRGAEVGVTEGQS